MTSSRRIFVMLFTLLPLLAAQCWGLCGVPQQKQASHQAAPPCHNVPAEPAKDAPAPCCAATATFDISSDNVAHFTPQPAVMEVAYGDAPLHLMSRWLATALPETLVSPPPGFPLILRV